MCKNARPFFKGGETTPAEALGEPVSVARSSYCRMSIHSGGKMFLGSADFCVSTQPRSQVAGHSAQRQEAVARGNGGLQQGVSGSGRPQPAYQALIGYVSNRLTADLRLLKPTDDSRPRLGGFNDQVQKVKRDDV